MKEEIQVVDLLKADKITLIVESGDLKTTFKTEAMLGLFNHIEQTLKQQQQAYDALRERLKGIEWVHSFLWVSDKSYHYCPACDGHYEDGIDNIPSGHKPDCWLNAEIKAIKENSN